MIERKLTSFQKNIITMRKLRGWTQLDAAYRIGIGVKRYQAWEEGRAEPFMHLLPGICEAFGFDSIDEMVGYKIKGYETSKTGKRLC